MPTKKKAAQAAEDPKRVAEKPAAEKELSPEERLHNTKLLLKKFRDVDYAVKVAEEELNLRFEQEYGTRLSTLEVNAELAGMDLSNTKLESYTRSIVRSKNMLGVIRAALEAVRQNPNQGELLYQILYLNYFSPQKPKNRDSIIDMLDDAGFPMVVSTYHLYLNTAIEAIDRILWGFTTRDCMEILCQFVSD